VLRQVPGTQQRPSRCLLNARFWHMVVPGVDLKTAQQPFGLAFSF
jgi:hypothetical protein